METLPVYIGLLFGMTTLLAISIFYSASSYSNRILVVLIIWLFIQTILGKNGYYLETTSLPPRLMLFVLVPVLAIILLITTPFGKEFIDNLDIEKLTLLHVVRIPVEIVLYLLFIHQTIPELMTFAGRNYDILSGISAPIIYYYGFKKKKLNRTVILVWNFICIGLLFNIVIHAILSAPFPFQQLAFDQPNVAVLYFPYNWLPTCIVPLVLFSHFASVRQLLVNK